MKKLIKIILALTFLGSFGCGEATEVGNPTGDIPTLRIVEGVIDTSTIDATKSLEAGALDPTLLTVVATGTDGSVRESSVDVDGGFAIGLEVGMAYSMEVRILSQVIGPFSFEQNDSGQRANRIELMEGGDPVDMGLVRYENGEFIPQNEPRRQMGGGSGGRP